MKQIGSYQAKTKLSDLLKKVRKGERFIITHHGQPVAQLIPDEPHQKRDCSEVIQEILSFKTKKDCSRLSTKELKETGRR